MRNDRQIPPRVTRRFLQLAAVAFALGAEAAPPAMVEPAVAARPLGVADAGDESRERSVEGDEISITAAIPSSHG